MTKQNSINLVPEYPTSLNHLYGYGARGYNGLQEKGFTYFVNTSYELCRLAQINNSAQYDVYEIAFLLKAGTYNFTILHDKGINRGVASFYLDDVLIGSLDCYNASTVPNFRTSYTVTVSNSGTHTFKIKINSKNASATGFAFYGTGIFASPVVSYE